MTREFLDDLKRGVHFGLVSPGGALKGAYLSGLLYPFARYGYLDYALYELVISASVWNVFFAHTPLAVMRKGMGIYPYHCTSKRFCNRRSLNVDFKYLEGVVREIIAPGLQQVEENSHKIFVGVTNALTGEGDIIRAQDAKPDIFRLASASSTMQGSPIEINGTPYIDGGFAFSQTELIRHAITYFPKVKHILVLSTHPAGLEKDVDLGHRLALQFLTRNGSMGLREMVRYKRERVRDNCKFLAPYLRREKEPYIHFLTPSGPKIWRMDQNEKKVLRAMRECANSVLPHLGHPVENLVLPR